MIQAHEIPCAPADGFNRPFLIYEEGLSKDDMVLYRVRSQQRPKGLTYRPSRCITIGLSYVVRCHTFPTSLTEMPSAWRVGLYNYLGPVDGTGESSVVSVDRLQRRRGGTRGWKVDGRGQTRQARPSFALPLRLCLLRNHVDLATLKGVAPTGLLTNTNAAADPPSTPPAAPHTPRAHHHFLFPPSRILSHLLDGSVRASPASSGMSRTAGDHGAGV